MGAGADGIRLTVARRRRRCRRHTRRLASFGLRRCNEARRPADADDAPTGRASLAALQTRNARAGAACRRDARHVAGAAWRHLTTTTLLPRRAPINRRRGDAGTRCGGAKMELHCPFVLAGLAAASRPGSQLALLPPRTPRRQLRRMMPRAGAGVDGSSAARASIPARPSWRSPATSLRPPCWAGQAAGAPPRLAPGMSKAGRGRS